jgi:NAD(P)-dependent dehydrogenase (short-subunit alcohol dehydrogenase family)
VEDLEGKVAFITGAARGQGRSHAVALAERGVDIIAVDLCEDIDTVSYALASSADLNETVRLVEEQHRRIVAYRTDVRDLDALSAALDRGVEELGRLDIVLANAGIAPSSIPVAETGAARSSSPAPPPVSRLLPMGPREAKRTSPASTGSSD